MGPLIRQLITNAIAAAPLTLWYGWLLGREVPKLADSIAYNVEHPDALQALRLFAYASSMSFLILFALLMIVRIAPRAVSSTNSGKVVALLGAFGSSLFLLLPYAPLSAVHAALSASLVTAGTFFSTCALAYLGRSISILPGARKLVLIGPYRFIRHPIYLGELCALVGTMMLFEQPWSLMLFSMIAAAQWRRILHEEAVLDRAFPQYSNYKRSTHRLIPGIY